MLAGGPYSELLQAAEALGFASPPTPVSQSSATQEVPALQQAQVLVEKCSEVHQLELRIAALSAHLASRTVADQSQLSARLGGLGNAASTLQLISASKDAIADHLRSASIRPSVPVAPAYQPDFAALLRCAASNAAVLHNGLQVLQWAASLSDRPSCWEDQLRVIRDSAQAMQDYMHAMQEFDQQLTKSSGVDGGGCGGGSSGGSGGTGAAAGGAAITATAAAAVRSSSSVPT